MTIIICHLTGTVWEGIKLKGIDDAPVCVPPLLLGLQEADKSTLFHTYHSHCLAEIGASKPVCSHLFSSLLLATISMAE